MIHKVAQSEKICVLCGDCCADRPRTRDAKGRYYCTCCYETCVERAAGRHVAPLTVNDDDDDTAEATSATMMDEILASGEALSRHCPGCHTEWDDGAVLCTACGYDLRAGRCLAGATPPPPRRRRVRLAEHGALDRPVSPPPEPSTVIGPGLLLLAALVVTTASIGGGAAVFPAAYLGGLALQVAIGLLGLWIASRLWLGGLGSLPMGLLRLAAIFATVDAVWILTSPLLVGGMLIVTLVYVGLLAWLFDLDLPDAMMVALVVFGVKIGVAALV